MYIVSVNMPFIFNHIDFFLSLRGKSVDILWIII